MKKENFFSRKGKVAGRIVYVTLCILICISLVSAPPVDSPGQSNSKTQPMKQKSELEEATKMYEEAKSNYDDKIKDAGENAEVLKKQNEELKKINTKRVVVKKVPVVKHVKPQTETMYFKKDGNFFERKIDRKDGLVIINIDSIEESIAKEVESYKNDEPDPITYDISGGNKKADVNKKTDVNKEKRNFFQKIFGKRKKSK